MTREEREILREKLDKMIEGKKAAGNTAASRSGAGGAEPSNGGVKSPYSSYYLWTGQRNKPLAAAIVALFILALGGGSAVFASGDSLPGDALYALKISMLEPLVGAFKGTSTAVAIWQANLVTARLSEAEALAGEGRLNDEKREKIEKLLDNHTGAFVSALDEVKKKDSPEKAEGVAGTLTSALIDHVNVLDKIAVEASTTARQNAESVSKLKENAASHAEKIDQKWTLPLSPGKPTEDLIHKNTKGPRGLDRI